MATQTVALETKNAVLEIAVKLTDEAGTFTVTDVVDWTQKSETTVRQAVAEWLHDGAVVKAEGRGQYRAVTTKTVTPNGTETGPDATTDVSDAADGDVVELPDGTPLGVVDLRSPGDVLAAEAHDQDPANAGLGYVVYAYGAGGQVLKINRGSTWVLTDDEQLANFKAATQLPVSGWSEDGKRRAIKELRAYVAGSPLTGPSSQPVFVAKPQELKKARSAG